MTALIITLFLIQLITIFVIVLLYSKLSKFQDLEKRQNELVNEMDNAISVYLMEMKEENDRLINELKKPAVSSAGAMDAPIRPMAHRPVNEQVEKAQKQQVPERKAEHARDPEMEQRKFVPVKQAANAYKKQKTDHVEEVEETALLEAELFTKADPQPAEKLSFEQQVIEHYRNGKTIEEIAKMMQRGKTEIELLVKFHT
ncbi:DUF6115 domain-containing protein [Solibacillus silvestris]|uniref:DUF6115 domain-containing protein n=1 Tax=Solibacillus silvestris TaxID=76853 RepID=UPI003F81E064